MAFPPLEIVAAVGYLGTLIGSGMSSAQGWTKIGINAYKNSDFKKEEFSSFIDETK